MVRSAARLRVSNHEAAGLAAIVRDAATTPLLRMTSEIASRPPRMTTTEKMSPDLAFILTLGFRMAVTAAFIVSASVITERSGPAIGALVATLPISAGPSYVFLALDHPAPFIAPAPPATPPVTPPPPLLPLPL